MSGSTLPTIPGIFTHGLPDAEWTVEHPQWVQATVWAARNAYDRQHTNNQQQGGAVALPLRCAACAAQILDTSASNRCSRCKQVSCNPSRASVTCTVTCAV